MRPVKIAVDVRPLIAPKTGIGRYLAELLQRLLLQSPHQWYLYGPRPAPAALPSPGLSNVVVRTPNLLDELHAQVLFPRWAEIDRADVFWSPRHRVPIRVQIPTVVTIHDLVWKHAPETMKPLNRLLERVTMPLSITRANRLIAVSRATERSIKLHFPEAAAKTTVIHPASFVPTSPPPASQASKPYGLFVGTVEPRKNLERLLSAFARIKDDVEHNLHIAGGPGWRMPAPSALIRANGLEGRVVALGAPEDEELIQQYACCDFVAMPSLYEGFGLPIIEAMTFGKPVLIGNTSAMPEVAGDAGLPVDPTSTSDIARGLKRMMTDTYLRSRMSDAARHRAADFSWDSAAAETIRVIESAAGA